MDPSFIDGLVAIMRRTGVEEIDYAQDGTRLRLRLHGAEPALVSETLPAVAAPAETARRIEVRATMPGVFFRALSPGASPLVAVGDRVAAGQTLALLEAMKMLVPIASDEAGTVLCIQAEDAASVARGDLLIVLDRGA